MALTATSLENTTSVEQLKKEVEDNIQEATPEQLVEWGKAIDLLCKQFTAAAEVFDKKADGFEEKEKELNTELNNHFSAKKSFFGFFTKKSREKDLQSTLEAQKECLKERAKTFEEAKICLGEASKLEELKKTVQTKVKEVLSHFEPLSSPIPSSRPIPSGDFTQGKGRAASLRKHGL